MKKNRLRTICFLLITSALVVGCASMGKKDGESAKEKKEKREQEKLAQKQVKDEYTGWVYIPEKNFKVMNGDVAVELRGDLGTFCIYGLPDAGAPVPLLSTLDSFSSTRFYLKAGRRVYPLTRTAGVKTEARRTPYGAQMAYTVDKVAQVVVDFSFLPSVATSSIVDMLRVTVYTINLGRRSDTFSVKAVFDTVLGENAESHFSTADGSLINTERQFFDMKDALWVRSASSRAAIQFLLCGEGISEVQSVTLSNKDSFDSMEWVPSIHEYRSFNSVLSYNNSALGINWQPSVLDPLTCSVVTMYVSVGVGGHDPAGKDFLAALASGNTVLSPASPEKTDGAAVAETHEVKAEESQPQSVAQVIEEDEGSSSVVVISEDEGDDSESIPTAQTSPTPTAAAPSAPAASSSTAPAAAPAASSAPAQTAASPAPVITVQASEEVSDDQLDPVYIQALLDRIAEIENTPGDIDSDELEKLNAELDQILSLLNR